MLGKASSAHNRVLGIRMGCNGGTEKASVGAEHAATTSRAERPLREDHPFMFRSVASKAASLPMDEKESWDSSCRVGVVVDENSTKNGFAKRGRNSKRRFPWNMPEVDPRQGGGDLQMLVGVNL